MDRVVGLLDIVGGKCKTSHTPRVEVGARELHHTDRDRIDPAFLPSVCERRIPIFASSTERNCLLAGCAVNRRRPRFQRVGSPTSGPQLEPTFLPLSLAP
jgi:hypothetical protein